MDFEAHVDGRISARLQYAKRLSRGEHGWRRPALWLVGFVLGPLK